LLSVKQQAARMQSLLLKLSPRQRLAISLWAYYDASILDIARTLQIEVNAANQLLHRAKANLKILLKEKP
jgi:RNA polymerase sigma-70 factor (ECF subfamily)